MSDYTLEDRRTLEALVQPDFILSHTWERETVGANLVRIYNHPDFVSGMVQMRVVRINSNPCYNHVHGFDCYKVQLEIGLIIREPILTSQVGLGALCSPDKDRREVARLVTLNLIDFEAHRRAGISPREFLDGGASTGFKSQAWVEKRIKGGQHVKVVDLTAQPLFDY